MNHLFEDYDRPGLAKLLCELRVGEHIRINTLKGHGVAKAYQRFYAAVLRVDRPFQFNITADRENGGVTCERTS